jgi:hypothetical protein
VLSLAARGSEHAACSRKLELYLCGLPAESALNLARAAVQAAFPAQAGTAGARSADRLRQLVTARYPDAAPLPVRTALDELVDPLGLVWSDAAGGLVRRPDEPTAQPTIQRNCVVCPIPTIVRARR